MRAALLSKRMCSSRRFVGGCWPAINSGRSRSGVQQRSHDTNNSVRDLLGVETQLIADHDYWSYQYQRDEELFHRCAPVSRVRPPEKRVVR
jgi:hypothetical protein